MARTKAVKIEDDVQRVGMFFATVKNIQVLDGDGDGIYRCYNCGDYANPLIEGQTKSEPTTKHRGWCLNCIYGFDQEQ